MRRIYAGNEGAWRPVVFPIARSVRRQHPASGLGGNPVHRAIAVNLAFVTSSKIWSGVKTWMLDFGAEVRVRGHAVHVFASDDRFLSACWDHDLDVHPGHFGSDYNPAAIM